MSEAYRRAGVDIEAGAEAVELIAELATGARRPEVADEVGGFAGLFRIGGGKLLAAATDGVGTKLEIARMTGRLDTVGIDLVAMCADDVVCAGAEPLFFLDYLAVGKVEPRRAASLVAGVAEGCRRAGCALLGGETAEHPGTMSEDGFDLAGFCVGAVDEASVIGPSRVVDGDVLIGLRYALDAAPVGLGRALADELLEPCAIYAPHVLALAREGLLHAAAHVTGGGLLENVPRSIPRGLGAEIERGTWPEQPVFGLVQAAAEATDDEMFATFNMGIGMVLLVGADDAERVLAGRGPHDVFRIGRVVEGAGVHVA